MKSSYTTLAVAAFFAAFTILFNPVSAFAGTTTQTGTTTSAKAVVEKVASTAPAPAPAKVATVTPIVATATIDYVNQKVATIETEFNKRINHFVAQGAEADKRLAAEIDQVANRVDALEKRPQGTSTCNLGPIEARVASLEKEMKSVKGQVAELPATILNQAECLIDQRINGLVAERIEPLEAKMATVGFNSPTATIGATTSQTVVPSVPATSVSASSSSTGGSQGQPAIIIINVPPAPQPTERTVLIPATAAPVSASFTPAPEVLRASIPRSRSSTAPVCSPPRRTVVATAPPAPPVTCAAPPVPRRGLFRSIGDFLFGNGVVSVRPAVCVQPPQFCPPPRMPCPPQVRQPVCQPSGFGWQQPWYPQRQMVMRDRCGPSWGGGGYPGGGNFGGGPIINNNNNNNSNNNNVLAMLPRYR